MHQFIRIISVDLVFSVAATVATVISLDLCYPFQTALAEISQIECCDKTLIIKIVNKIRHSLAKLTCLLMTASMQI